MSAAASAASSIGISMTFGRDKASQNSPIKITRETIGVQTPAIRSKPATTATDGEMSDSARSARSIVDTAQATTRPPQALRSTRRPILGGPAGNMEKRRCSGDPTEKAMFR